MYKYEKIRYQNTDCHVFTFNPAQYPSKLTLGIVGKKEKLSDIKNLSMLNKGYKEICKTNIGFFGSDAEHYGALAYDGKYISGSPVNVPGIELWLDKDNILNIGDLTLAEAKQLAPNVQWLTSISYSLVINSKKELRNKDSYAHAKYDNPRTLVGQKANQDMVMVVVDGRSGWDAGLTADESADFMLLLGCVVAGNGDGGGSSEMIYNGKMVNSPSDGSERLVGSSLQVFEKPLVIGGISVIEDFIPISNKTSRPQYPMTPKYITIHNTGNSKKNADAKQHTEYVDNTTAYVSWHFTVDDINIFQELPLNESAYHAGDGNGDGNRKSIGIEICENIDGDYQKAEENAINLIRYLMIEFNIPIENVVPHQHWSGKYCPHIILDYGWDKFINRILGNVLPQITENVNIKYKNKIIKGYLTTDNRTVVEVRQLAELLGYFVDWDMETRSVIIK